MDQSVVKERRGRPSKKEKGGGYVVGSPNTSTPEVQMVNNTNSNNVVESSLSVDIELVESAPSSGISRGRRKQRVLENGSGLDSKEWKKMKSERSLEFTPVRRSSRHFRNLAPPHCAGNATRQNASTDVPDDVEGSPFMNAVVKVFCVHTDPNFSLPWERKRQCSSNSSGFILDGRRVLTNAHSVEHHTQVKLKKRGSDTKYLATVLAIGTEYDIAMLTVNDDEFWEGVIPVQFGSLPSLQDAVTVVCYPIGGDTISVTGGVVSRIEVLSYVHGATELLGVQLDAAINAGNSGGPAFNDKGDCVGIAFQALKHEDAENIGYVVPTPVITHFITD